MKKLIKIYAGVLLGASYALILRLVFNVTDWGEIFSLFSITFIWLAPIAIGLIPLFYATSEQLNSWRYRVASPVLTVVVFFILCFLTRIEDLICLWIILLPYMLVALCCGLVAGEIIKNVKKRKGTLFTILIFPFIACPIEQQFKTPVDSYMVTTKVVINATPQTIWSNIIRVRQIEDSEYEKGFFNYAGIPRPLYAELDRDTLGARRVGHFEGGLQFVETVNSWERNKHIGFDIMVVPSTIRQTIFDQHILKGNHFRFLNADYFLRRLPNGQTELILQSSYELNSKINGYASYCGNQLLADFQERLLKVIKVRCEK